MDWTYKPIRLCPQHKDELRTEGKHEKEKVFKGFVGIMPLFLVFPKAVSYPLDNCYITLLYGLWSFLPEFITPLSSTTGVILGVTNRRALKENVISIFAIKNK